MRVVGTGTTSVIEALAEKVAREKGSLTEGARAATKGGSYGLKHNTSKMNQTQLDGLLALLYISATILIRAPA